jgi:hypothetical protein
MPETNIQVNTTYQIPLADAERYTARWREDHRGSDKAFTINVQELKDIIDELGRRHHHHCPIEQIRVYFGIKDDGKEGLILVGVDKDGKDITTLPPTSDGADDDVDNSGTYDFTKPCPDTCDETSPLS